MPSLYLNIFLWFLTIPVSFLLVNSNKQSLRYVRNAFWAFLIVASLIIGLRWNMGVDYENYYTVISTPIEKNTYIDRFELIPRYLIVFIQYWNLPYSTWYIAMAFFHFLFLWLASNNGFKRLLPWVLFFFYYSLFDLSLNITRQTVALMVILYAYTFIYKKNLKAYLLLVGIAFCFHRTSLLSLPFYWIASYISINNRFIQVVIVSLCIFVGSFLKNYLWDFIQGLEALRYAHYADAVFDYGSSGTGLGVIANYIKYFVIIYYSNILKNKYKEQGFQIFYNLTFIDMCIYSAVTDDLALSRILMYFSSTNIITTSFLFHYLSKSHKVFDKFVFLFLLLMFLTIMIYSVYNGPTWYFII